MIIHVGEAQYVGCILAEWQKYALPLSPKNSPHQCWMHVDSDKSMPDVMPKWWQYIPPHVPLNFAPVYVHGQVRNPSRPRRLVGLCRHGARSGRFTDMFKQLIKDTDAVHFHEAYYAIPLCGIFLKRPEKS